MFTCNASTFLQDNQNQATESD